MPPWLSTLLAALLAAGYLAGNAALDRAPSPAEVVALAVGCAALTAALTSAHARRQVRRKAQAMAPAVAHLSDDPAKGTLDQLHRLIEKSDLAPLWGPLDGLATAYRKALASVVEVRERLERVRAGSPVKAVSATHIVIGSSRRRLVARLAPNFHFLTATQPLCRFLNRSNAELMSRSILELVHPEDAARLRRALREALRDGEAHDVMARAVSPDGERHLQIDIMTCYNDAGRPINLRCHFLDVTDRVRTEMELRRITAEVSEANARLRKSHQEMERLKESYRDLYHHAPILYFSLDPAGRLVAFNVHFLRTVGRPREQLQLAPYETLLTPDARAALRADPGMMHRPDEVETRWVRGDGSVIDVWIGTTTVRDASGEFVRSRSAARDVTETKRLAADLQAKADELLRANAELRRINQELEEFSYVVSHDLKEPLRTVEAFSTFLAQDYGPQIEGDGRGYIDHLVQASRRLGRLIDDLLVLSRNGRVIDSPRPFEWGPVVDTVIGDLHDLIGRTGATVRVEGDLPECLGDPERIIQLLSNLVTNGLRYNNGDAPEVVIAGHAGPGAEHATLSVRDNGIGIDPKYHEQIFRLFRRLHHRDEVEGTGAGLAICKRIVEAHGGRLWVESRPGEGATFLFTLPAAPLRRKEVVADVPALAAGR